MIKIEFFLIFCLFFISAFSLAPGLASNQRSTSLQSVAIPFQGLPWNVKYSSYFNQSSNSFTLYSVSLSNNSFIFQDFTYDPFGFTALPSTVIPFSSLHNFSSIIDFNYYRVSTTRFLLVSYYFNQSNYLDLYIFGPTNTSFTFSGSFNIVKIAQFTDSSDVFFILQNSTFFLIFKYILDSKELLTFFSTNTLSINGEIQNVNTFILDNKIFVSFGIYGQVTNELISSSVFIIDQYHILFNKTFNQFFFKTFTPYQNGLLFFQNINSTYFDYNFATDEVTRLMSNNNYGFDEVFAPFDNNSFVDLGAETLSIINILHSNVNPVLIYQSTYIAKKNSNNFYNQSSVQTFILNGSKYYVLSGISYNQTFSITINSITEAPQDFFQPNSNSSASFITAGNIVQTDHLPALWFFIIISSIIILVGAFLYFYYHNANYKQENVSKLNPKINTELIKKNLIKCSFCGTDTSPGDLFCQNCGNKV